MRYRNLRFPGGREKALTLSYDDGRVFDRELIRIADKYGIKVTLNINSDRHELSFEELKELTEPGGHEIAVHGANHMAPGIITPVEGIRDALDGRRGLERAFDRIIRGMAYPDCGIRTASEEKKDNIKHFLKDLGIVYARSLGGDNDKFAMPTDWYEWIPTAHHMNPNMMQYLDKFLELKLSKYGAQRGPRLFYLWGHSFEYDRDNNWELLEEFCQKAGNHEEIWYATNIEIYEYAKAYESLIFNVDGTKVYNPTLVPVWFEVIDTKNGDIVFCVKSGETLELS